MAELQNDSFLTVSGFTRTELKIKASKFIASLVPVMNELAAKEFIEKIASEFRDATHNCYAYRIGAGDAVRSRYCDAGEPSGTAGSAILSAIEHHGVTNISLVVTRYFGGTKLGVGPLRRAYRDSALSAIERSTVQAKYIMQRFSFTVSYAQLKETKRILKSLGAEIYSEEYLQDARFIIDIRKSLVNEFENRFRGLTKGRAPQSIKNGNANLHF